MNENVTVNHTARNGLVNIQEVSCSRKRKRVQSYERLFIIWGGFSIFFMI